MGVRVGKGKYCGGSRTAWGKMQGCAMAGADGMVWGRIMNHPGSWWGKA